MRVRLAAFLTTLAAFGCATLPDYTPVQQVTLLDQGWSQAERDQFAHTSKAHA